MKYIGLRIGHPALTIRMPGFQMGPVYDHLLTSTRTANGNVSDIARRKIMKALDYLLLISQEKKVTNRTSGRKLQFKIAFITLTLPSSQKHTDKEIKNTCLNQFIIEIKKYYYVKNYLWRAEKQKNGNIHFHIIVDKFIPYQELRDRWNRIINKLGYVDSYRDNMQTFYKDGFRLHQNLLGTWSAKQQRAAYERGARTHWNSPNSTDIHSVQKIHNIKAYVSKYMTKNDKPDKTDNDTTQGYSSQTGRIWGSNQELGNIKGAQTEMDNQLEEEIKLIQGCRESKVYASQYFTVIYFDIELLKDFPQVKLFKLFSQYLIDKFDYNYQTGLAI